MDFSIIIESIPEYLDGVWLTIQLVSLSLLIGLLLAIPFAILS